MPHIQASRSAPLATGLVTWPLLCIYLLFHVQIIHVLVATGAQTPNVRIESATHHPPRVVKASTNIKQGIGAISSYNLVSAVMVGARCAKGPCSTTWERVQCLKASRRRELPEGRSERAVHLDVLDSFRHQAQPLVPTVNVDIVVVQLDGEMQLRTVLVRKVVAQRAMLVHG